MAYVDFKIFNCAKATSKFKYVVSLGDIKSSSKTNPVQLQWGFTLIMLTVFDVELTHPNLTFIIPSSSECSSVTVFTLLYI